MIRRLFRGVRRRDGVLVLIAVLNFLHMWRAAADAPRDGFSWYAGVPVWLFMPSRILLATLCLGARRWWMELAAVILAAHVVASNLFYFSAPYYLALEWRTEPTFFETPAFQTVLAAIVLVLALRRVTNRLRHGRRSTAFKATIAVVACLAVMGYASNLVSRASAERDVARFVYRDVLHSRQYVTTPDLEAFKRFCEIGASVTCTDPACAPVRWQADVQPWEWVYAFVGVTTFVAPFLLEVGYRSCPDERPPGAAYVPPCEADGRALVVGFFGKTVLVRRSSNLMTSAQPYLWPY